MLIRLCIIVIKIFFIREIPIISIMWISWSWTVNWKITERIYQPSTGNYRKWFSIILNDSNQILSIVRCPLVSDGDCCYNIFE